MSEKKEKFIIFALAGVLLLIVCLPVKKQEKAAESENRSTTINNSSFYQTDRKEESSEKGSEADGVSDTDGYVRAMEQELEDLLSCMEGVGKVKVMITLQSTSEDIVEKDRPAVRSNMTENDAAGGSRNTNDMNSEESTVFMTDGNGRQIPYVRKTIQPVVGGVAVLAEGGGREAVRQNISEAIQALFGIDANKIKIAKMKTIK